MTRPRPIFLALILITIALGLFTRSSYMPAKGGFIATYAGDTLWASMVYFILCFVFPRHASLKIAIIALTFSYAIELSQLCQQDWLNNIRQTRIGALILGRGFVWSDFLCYTTGVMLAYLIDSKVALIRKNN